MAGAEVGPAQDAPAPRSAQGLVGGERHDVGDTDRIGVHPAGDEPGDVRGIEEEQRSDLVRDLGGSGAGSMIRG